MTKRALEDVLWRATMLCLGLDPDDPSGEVQRRVRISWPESETGNSNWEMEENVVFLRVSPGMDPYGQLRDIRYEYSAETDSATEIVAYHRAWQIMWICYGPDSDECADRIRIGILRPGVHEFLMARGVAIRPDIPDPIRMPELDETGAWWERCDVTAQAYERVERRYPSAFFDHPPAITTIPEDKEE